MQAFGKEYRWWFFVFVILAFVLGIGLGWDVRIYTTNGRWWWIMHL